MTAVDKSALALGEPKRVRSEQHRRWIAELPCVACWILAFPNGKMWDAGIISQAAHLRAGQRGGMGLKPCDSETIPLCPEHHAEQHRSGEVMWWFEIMRRLAEKLAGMSPNKKVRDAT